MQVIKREVLEKLSTNPKAKGRLAYEFAKHSVTIDRWIEENNAMLTTPTALNAISEELELDKAELLIEA
jgi:hypothetical protein